MIRFSCPKCSKVFERPDDMAGSVFACSCGQKMEIPGAAEESPEPGPVRHEPRSPSRPSVERRLEELEGEVDGLRRRLNAGRSNLRKLAWATLIAELLLFLFLWGVSNRVSTLSDRLTLLILH